MAEGIVDSVIEETTTPTETPEVKEPAWFSQMSKEMREDADNKAALSGFKSIGDLANAYLQNKKDLGNAIVRPKGDNPEEVKAFLMKLGMPENASDYELDNFDQEENELANAKEIFRKMAHEAALTKGQAKTIWKHEMAMAKASKNVSEAEHKKYEESFEPSYNKIMEKAYPVDSERTKAIKGEIGLVQGMFTQNPAIGKAFKTSGLIYNAEVMHELALYIKKNTAESFIDSESGTKEAKPIGVMGNYSEEFLKAAGK